MNNEKFIQKYTPSNELSQFIDYYWVIDRGKTSQSQVSSILPISNINIIFHLEDSLNVKCKCCTYSATPKAYVEGQYTRAVNVKLKDKVFMIGVSFFPWTAHLFLKSPVSEFTNNIIDLCLIDNEYDRLHNDLYDNALITQKINNLNLFFEQKALRLSSKALDINKRLKVVYDFNPITSPSKIATNNNMSLRRLQQIFKDYIGLSPNKVISKMRFQNFYKLLPTACHTNFTQIALQSGYYDQAHCIHNVKEFSGMTPKQLYNTQEIFRKIELS